MSTPLLAQETLDETKANVYKWAIIIGGAVIALAAAAGAFCQAKAISSACEGISRNPGSAPHIRFLLIFGLVLIETLVIYALLISITLVMINWGKYL
jgi:F-type H+-transporting ATPase subunit c